MNISCKFAHVNTTLYSILGNSPPNKKGNEQLPLPLNSIYSSSFFTIHLKSIVPLVVRCIQQIELHQ